MLPVSVHVLSNIDACKETQNKPLSPPLTLSLWKSLDTNSSNTDRACVELLLECAIFLADKKPVQISREPKGGEWLFILLAEINKQGSTELHNPAFLEYLRELIIIIIHILVNLT